MTGVKLYCDECQKWYDENYVALRGEIYDVCENFLGEDVVSFNCPECEQDCKSRRLGRI